MKYNALYDYIKKYSATIHTHPHCKKDSKKMNTTMVDPIAGSTNMAIVLIATPSQHSLCNGLVEDPIEGFYSII